MLPRAIACRLSRLPLVLLLLGSVSGGLQAAEPPLQRSVVAEQTDQRQRLLGVWALVDNANNLFNVRLTSDGRALSTSGVDGVPLAGATQLRANQLYEQGRWQLWGNGVRIDYGDGWSDVILTGPAGPVQWSWAPGVSRLGPPTNHGKAVQLTGAMAAAVGIYRIQPAQATLPPTTVSLMSNGLAFNAIDPLAGGTWRLINGNVVIVWASGWRTQFEPKVQGALQVQIWEPGRPQPSPPSAIRSGFRIEEAQP